MPTRPSKRSTALEGCAPTESQYWMRSRLRLMCLFPSFPGVGSYHPTFSTCFPSRFARASATMIR